MPVNGSPGESRQIFVEKRMRVKEKLDSYSGSRCHYFSTKSLRLCVSSTAKALSTSEILSFIFVCVLEVNETLCKDRTKSLKLSFFFYILYFVLLFYLTFFFFFFVQLCVLKMWEVICRLISLLFHLNVKVLILSCFNSLKVKIRPTPPSRIPFHILQPYSM